MHAVYVGIIGDKVESEKKSNSDSVAAAVKNSRRNTQSHVISGGNSATNFF